MEDGMGGDDIGTIFNPEYSISNVEQACKDLAFFIVERVFIIAVSFVLSLQATSHYLSSTL